jgi:hypothetical protein
VESTTRPEVIESFQRLRGLLEAPVKIPPPPPFGIEKYDSINPPLALRPRVEPPDDTDTHAVFPEAIVSTHWIQKGIRLGDEHCLVDDPS